MHHPVPFRLGFVLTAVGLALPAGTVFREVPAGTDPGHRLVFVTAWLAAGLWWGGATLLAGYDDEDRPSEPGRYLWAAGAGFAVLHTAVAMHCAHGWSHAAAYAHTASAGGVGAGVYVNYAFVLAWVLDALWAVVSPGRYARRSRWLTRAVYGFLAFVVFNATVVFGGWPARVVFGLLFGLAAAGWWSNRPPSPTR